MYKEHVPLIRDYALESKDNVFRVGLFVLGTMNRYLEVVGRIMQEFDDTGLTSRWFSKSQRYALETLFDSREYLYHRVKLWVRTPAYPVDMLREVIEFPGYGIVKGAFLLQLLGFNIGCLDRHNLRLAGLKESLFTKVPTSAQGLQARLVTYAALCENLGGSEFLWNQWCNHVAMLRPYAFKNGEAVSQFHVDTIVKG